MGGTTSKCAMIERGRYAVESIYHIGGPDAGFPIRGNVIDILEVGVGGGSIAWLDEQRRLNVGPRSAGSMPGPACYGTRRHRADRDRRQSAARPPRSRAISSAARWSSRPEPARDALDANASPNRSATAATTRVTRAAKGVLTIANLTMSSIIKKVSIARGYDPRDFALFCYGGGGPLHGIELARALNIPRVIVPPEPGNFSALGMLLADPRLDTAQTFVVRLNPENLGQGVGDLSPSWKRRAAPRCGASSARATITIEREAEMRYKGQHHSIKIAARRSDDRATAARALRRRVSAALRPRQRRGGGRDRRAAFARDAAHEAAGDRPPGAGHRRPASVPELDSPADLSFWTKIASCRHRSTIAMRSAADFTAPARR